MRDGERGEPRTIGPARLERGMRAPAFRKRLDHRVLRLFRHTTRLVVHDVDDSTRLGGEHTDTLGRVEEGHSGEILAHTLRGVLVHPVLEDALLDPVVKALISKVYAELVERVGANGGLGNVLRAREVEQTDEARVVFATELLVDVLVDPGEEERVERLGEAVSVLRGAIFVEEDGTQFLLDELGLVREDDFKGGRGHAEELCDKVEQFRVSDDGRVFVPMAVVNEVDVAKMKNGREQLASLRDVSLRETNVLERDLELLEADSIVIASEWSAVGAQVAIGRLIKEVQVLPLLLARTGKQIVEDVEIAFARGRTGDSVPFKVIVERLDTG